MHDRTDNLTHCDREPIHIPGKIQSYGYLACVSKHDFTISYLSENMAELTGISLQQLASADIGALFLNNNIQLRNAHLTQLRDFAADENEQKLALLNIRIRNAPYFLIAHKSADNLILEFEPGNNGHTMELQQMIGSSVSQILEGNTINKALQNAAKQIKQIIGYNRVMVYKFWEDGHGEVVAEERDENQESFMGLHYPASDIPKQARELYKINLVRIIADVGSIPVSIAASGNELAARPLDLTHSTLRAVSPVHIEYLKNMGVAASFSISLIVNDELWGLIACHNSTPKFIDYKAREGAKLIGQILSSSIEYKAGEEGKDALRSFNNASLEILRFLQSNDSVTVALTQPVYNLLSITNAKGAAILFDKEIRTLGVTPPAEEIQKLSEWLSKNINQKIYSTEALVNVYDNAAAIKKTSSGLLACELSREMGEYILWFKPERLHTVNWAGNPTKQETVNEKGEIKISPRESFAAWTEEVRNTSEPWNRNEFAAVIKLREYVLQAISQKANQIRLLNEKLQEAYEELDTFSFTISHDLKTPLASVKNYTEILIEEGQGFKEEELGMLKRIVKGAEKMNTLINEVLAYSRIGRKEPVMGQVDMKNLLTDIVAELKSIYKDPSPEIIIGNTPAVTGDQTMILQVFSNLLSNAVKYSSKRDKPVIKVNGEDLPQEVIYSISDNGVGIDMSFGNQIFEIFRRLNNANLFEGTGVGLSIVKRIVEKHRGKIWYESELGIGTVFYISFNKQ